ncbi:MAG: aldo/keto reductase [Actinomycetota bacterium]|nr:aldo/keto reductase [Actinomycetota bacterium]
MIDRRPFGRTGHHSTRLIFGAAALGAMSQQRADSTMAQVLAAGINHIDTAASYGNAEVRLHPFLAEHRGDFFLATKTGERDGAAARAELERSLQRMGVEQLDLVQMHNLVEPDEWVVAHGPGGALEALVRAREEGLVRFIGVTGHGTRIPAMHVRSLQRFDYDSVLFPYNFSMMSSPAYRADVEQLLEVCAERDVAVQTIKAVARRRWSPDTTERRLSWYEPLPEGPALQRAVAYVLGRPQLFLNTSSDARLLGSIVGAVAKAAGVPDDEAMAADAEELAITPLFDGAELERI